jgi:hypothetical protein
MRPFADLGSRRPSRASSVSVISSENSCRARLQNRTTARIAVADCRRYAPCSPASEILVSRAAANDRHSGWVCSEGSRGVHDKLSKQTPVGRDSKVYLSQHRGDYFLASVRAGDCSATAEHRSLRFLLLFQDEIGLLCRQLGLGC